MKKKALREPTNHTVKLPRIALRSPSYPSLMQNKVFRAFTFLGQMHGMPEVMEMPSATFRKLLNIHDYEHLEQELHAVAGVSFAWPGLKRGEKKGGKITPIPDAYWDEDTIFWSFSPMYRVICKELHMRNKGYASLEWDLISQFTSIYSLRIWELCKASVHSSGFDATTPRMRMSELRAAIGVPPDAYRNGNQDGPLLLNCVRKPMEEVLRLGGMEIEFKRQGRAHQAWYWFSIKGKKKQQLSLPTFDAGLLAEAKVVASGDLRSRILAAIDALEPERRAEIEEAIEESGYTMEQHPRGVSGVLAREGIDVTPTHLK